MTRLLVVVLSMLCCLSVRADERILRFDSAISVARDATMTVSETIQVRAEGDRIRRGIYRDTRFGSAQGRQHSTSGPSPQACSTQPGTGQGRGQRRLGELLTRARQAPG